jgi:hypothetical protein
MVSPESMLLEASRVVMLSYDAVVLPSPETLIVLTAAAFAILLVAFVGKRRRRRNAAKLRKELGRMSARITALELVENRYLLMKIKSAADIAPAPPAVAASSNGHDLGAD